MLRCATFRLLSNNKHYNNLNILGHNARNIFFFRPLTETQLLFY